MTIRARKGDLTIEMTAINPLVTEYVIHNGEKTTSVLVRHYEGTISPQEKFDIERRILRAFEVEIGENK